MQLVTPFFLLIIFSFAASVGSFINMATYRIPLQISIVTPRSYCNNCKKTLSIRALIPFFGYFLTKGKCSHCHIRIPFEYPLIEIFTGCFFLFAFFYYEAHLYLPYSFTYYLHSGLLIQFITACWLFSTGLLLSRIDIEHYILPDIIVIPGTFVSLLLGTFNPQVGFKQSILGIVVGGLGLFLFSKIYEFIRKKEGLGFGDVKYLAFLGGVIGLFGVAFTLSLASVLGSIIGVLVLVFQKKSLQTPIPFGPFLAFSGLVYFLLSKNFAIS